MKVEIKRTLSGKYWGAYVYGMSLPVVTATTKGEIKQYVDSALRQASLRGKR